MTKKEILEALQEMMDFALAAGYNFYEALSNFEHEVEKLIKILESE